MARLGVRIAVANPVFQDCSRFRVAVRGVEAAAWLFS
jgi:hypothetical protein